MRRDDELLASGRLAGDALAEATGLVGEMHLTIAEQVASFFPPGARAIAKTPMAVASAVYSALATGHRLFPPMVAAVLARSSAVEQPLSDTTFGRFALPAVNGIWGDTVARRHPTLAVQTSVRLNRADVPLTAEGLAAAYPDASGRLVIFAHGLAESETFWWRPPGGGEEIDDSTAPLSYGERLHQDEGWTPVYLRYNSGLRISENGARIADLLQLITTQWPVPITEIALVGHSMGGLVTRSACRHAEIEGQAWVRAVRTVVTLGTPHFGAPLERAVHVADWVLSQVPVTAPLGRLLRSRSAGVRDLRFGAVVPDDWEGHDPDALLRDTCTEVPFLEDATYYFVTASLARDPGHPAGHLLGDGLVHRGSAAGIGRLRRLPFDADSRHLNGLHHFELLNHPDVYDLLREWLRRPPNGIEGAGTDGGE